MQDNQETRAEWQRLVANMLQQEPPISPEEWRRQMAVEYILSRLLLHLKERGEHDLVGSVLDPPSGTEEKMTYVNVFHRIAFLMRNSRWSSS